MPTDPSRSRGFRSCVVLQAVVLEQVMESTRRWLLWKVGCVFGNAYRRDARQRINPQMEVETDGPATAPPLVSVVIPTHNRSRLVVRAVKSVLAQQGVDLEVIVVDDASRDDTAKVVGSLTDPRIRFLAHETNRGASAARNTGIGMAGGEYIAFLDSDDEWLPGKAAAQAAVLTGDPAVGLVYCGFRTVDEEMDLGIDRNIEVHRGDVFGDLLRGWCPDTTSMLMARRDLLEEVGLFDTSLAGFQDYDLLLRLSRVTRFDLVEERLVVKHEHGGPQLTTDTAARQRALEVLVEKWRPEIERVHGPEALRQMGRVHHRRILELALVHALRQGDRLAAWRQYPAFLRVCRGEGFSLAGLRLCLSPLPGLLFGFGAYRRVRRAWRRLSLRA